MQRFSWIGMAVVLGMVATCAHTSQKAEEAYDLAAEAYTAKATANDLEKRVDEIEFRLDEIESRLGV